MFAGVGSLGPSSPLGMAVASGSSTSGALAQSLPGTARPNRSTSGPLPPRRGLRQISRGRPVAGNLAADADVRGTNDWPSRPRPETLPLSTPARAARSDLPGTAARSTKWPQKRTRQRPGPAARDATAVDRVACEPTFVGVAPARCGRDGSDAARSQDRGDCRQGGQCAANRPHQRHGTGQHQIEFTKGWPSSRAALQLEHDRSDVKIDPIGENFSYA